MKHVFVVHSNITYLISLGVISKEKYNLNDVLIISDGFSCNGPVPIVVVKTAANRTIMRSSFIRYIKLYFNPRYELYRELDNFLKGECFTAYVPVLHLIKKLVLLHPNCKQFHFIEEGTASYYTTMTFDEYAIVYNNKPWFYSKNLQGLIDRLHTAYKEFGFRSGMIESIPISYMNHDSAGRTFYCLSDDAYPALKYGKKVVLDLSLSLDSYIWKDTVLELQNVCLWIGDPDVAGRYGYDSYEHCIIEKLIPAIGNNKLFIRYHYRENIRQRKAFTGILDRYSVDYDFIDDKQIMELVFIKSKSCKCFSFASSLSVYAKILGHESYSIANGISSLKKNIDEVMPCFSKFVTYL